MKKRLFSLICMLAFCLELLPAAALAAQEPVSYIDRSWNGSTVTETEKTVSNYTSITESTTDWSSGWYVASGNVTINKRVQLQGNVYLILEDTCVLTIHGGIHLEGTNSLTIYGQSDGADTMGKLTASITSENMAVDSAAIGGNTGEAGGTMTVYGGTVEATITVTNNRLSGSDTSQGSNNRYFEGAVYGATIGGGGTETGNGGTGGTMTVYGGTVEATATVTNNNFPSDSDTSQESDFGSFPGGTYGAAIGGGGTGTGNGGSGGTIAIYSGTVRAESNSGAGIGGGCGYDGDGGIGGTITISGGTVRAESCSGAGIGGGSGGRDGGDGGEITIAGGTVWAESYFGGGIGGGCNLGGGDDGGDGGNITISGGTVEAQSASGAAIGGGNSGYGISSEGGVSPEKGDGGSGGNIIISGGSVTATTFAGRTIGLFAEMNEGRWAGAAIGGGGSGGSSGNITISGGIVTATVSSQPAPNVDPDVDPIYSAGIGSGSISSGSGTITISGGTVFAQSPDGAGIGGGENSNGIIIVIEGGTVTAASTNGAGIGGGMVRALSATPDSDATYSGGEITISGGTVSTQSTNGAGIGSGAVIHDVSDGSMISERDTPDINGGKITILSGTVSAQSVKGAGIGGGSGQVTVGSNVTVDLSNPTPPSLTLSSGSGGTVTISGGTVEAVSTEGVGIGSGGMPSYQSKSPNVDQYIHCSSGEAGTFTTGTDGNTMLFATGSIDHIQDDDDTSAWRGVIFLGSEGRIYGNEVTLSTDCTVPGGKQLSIGEGQSILLDTGVTLTIDNENCLTGAGTLGAGGRYQILNPLPVFTPATLVYTGSDLSGSVSLIAPASPVSVMGQAFTISGSPNYDDWVITTPAGGMVQVGTYPFSAYNEKLDYTITGQVAVVTNSSSHSSSNNHSIVLEQSAHGVVTASHSTAASGAVITLTATPDKGYALTSLTVTDNKGNEIDLTDKGGNQYCFTMSGSKVTVEAVFTPMPLPFVDVPENAWYYNAVWHAYIQGLMNGTSADLFEPDGTMTRAMLVTILHRQAGEPVVNYLMPFDDVAEGTWYSEAVRWAASEGIVTGTSATTFAPDAPITREQFAAILYRYAQQSGTDVSVGEDTNILSYADALDISEYATPAMQWACGAGVIKGSGANLNPQDSAIRAEAAAMLMRFIQTVT